MSVLQSIIRWPMSKVKKPYTVPVLDENGELPEGVGGATDPANLDQAGAVTGQVLVWDGLKWQPGSNLYPTSTVLAATDVTGTSAILRCTVDSFGMVSRTALEVAFDYKEDEATSWTRTSAQAVDVLRTVTQSISGLSLTTGYTFRPVAIDVLNVGVELLGEEASFTTSRAGIEAPTITSPDNNAVDIGATLTIETDAFNCIGDIDTHASTTLRLYKTSVPEVIVWETTKSSGDLTSIAIDSGVHEAGIEYWLDVIHTGETYGNSPASSITYTTASSFLSAGDLQAGYYVTVASEDFISGETLASEIGLVEGTAYNSETPWLKFAWNEGTTMVPQRPLRYGLSWDAINAIDAVYGGANAPIVLINGEDYKVRLMRMADIDPFKANKEDEITGPNNEWNKLMLPIHANAPNSWENPEYVDEPTEDWNINFTDTDLLTSWRAGEGTQQWGQETDSQDSTSHVVRGYTGVSALDTIYSGSSYERYGWRPVLEKM